jgi:tripartite-type tricarboxylate transporter receptor subunit TctC
MRALRQTAAIRLAKAVQRGNVMKLARRQFLQSAAAAAALPAMSRVTWAQTYPARPVRVIVAAAAGGATDILARLIGQRLSIAFGQQFIIENRPGGSYSIGTEAVVRAPADGYTLLAISSVHVINATLYDKLNYNFIRDIAPVAGIMRTPLVVVVNPSFPAKTISELIGYAKANPGKVNFASGGSGSALHVAGELFKMMTNVDMVHVPYRGEGLALTDLLGGQVQLMFAAPAAAIEHIKSGKLRALAVSTPTRWEELPEIPMVGEFVPGYEAIGVFGIGAPRNTPVEIIDKLNNEINSVIAHPQIKERLIELGGVPMSMTPTDFRKFIANETEKWGKVIRAAGIKPE